MAGCLACRPFGTPRRCGVGRKGRLEQNAGQICAQIKDKDRNGGKDMAALVKHMAEDDLPGWGWRRAQRTQNQSGELIKAWADAGATEGVNNRDFIVRQNSRKKPLENAEGTR